MGSNTLTQLSDQTNRVMFTYVCKAEMWSLCKCTILSRLQSHVHALQACFLLHACLKRACSLPFTHVCLFQSPASLLSGEKLSGFLFFFLPREPFGNEIMHTRSRLTHFQSSHQRGCDAEGCNTQKHPRSGRRARAAAHARPPHGNVLRGIDKRR